MGHSNIMDYTGTKIKCKNAIAKINANCVGAPFDTWAIEKETTTAGIWAFEKPPIEGSHGFQQAEMVSGVSPTLGEVNKAEYPQEEGM